jgi:hypothetical protein
MKPVLSDDEIERLDSAIQNELPDLVRRAQLREAAMAEQTLSGELRRALVAAGIRQESAAVEAGITLPEYADWMTGVAPLPSTAIDRLASLIHAHLQPAP